MKRKEQEYWLSGRALIWYLVSVIAIAIAFVCYFHLRPVRGWSLDGEGLIEVSSQVVEVRVVPYSTWGRRIYFRAEARAIFERNGHPYDEWLPASLTNSNRPELEWWLSKTKQTPAVVYINGDDPRVGVVRLTAKF